MNIPPFDAESNTIGYREMLNYLEAYLSCTEFDACSLQPTNGASGEHAGLLVVSKYQENRTGPRNEVSARNEHRQRSGAADRHEDQVD